VGLSATMVWEIRSAGSDNSGGGFKAGASGTDYSQQNAAQFSGTNLAVDAVTNTVVSSATHNFVAADVGNVIQVTAGAGWTVGFYEILSVAANKATLDRSPAAAGTTGGTWAEGGALATVNKCNGAKVTGNKAWIKAGTYTSTTRQDWTTTDSTWNGADPTLLLGYNAVRGDNPKGSGRPVLSCSTAGVDVFGLSGAGVQAAHLVVDGNDAARDGVTDPGTGTTGRGGTLWYVTVKRCTRYGVLSIPTLSKCRVTDMAAGSTAAFRVNQASFCVADNNPCPGFSQAGNNENMTAMGCVSAWNTGASSDGFAADNYLSSSQHDGGVAYNNGRHGFNFADGTYNAITQLTNSVAYGNGGYGVKGQSRPALLNVDANAYGSNTSGNITGYAAGPADVALTADPYTGADATSVLNADSVDDVFALFRPNATAGGGASLRGAGYPSYEDVGAAQHQDAGGGAAPVGLLTGGRM
jgi:hypothetical protein